MAAAFSGSGVACPTHLPHPMCRSTCQFGMVFVLPCGFVVAQELEQSLAANFIAGGLDKKSTATPRANQSVDFLDQVLRQ